MSRIMRFVAPKLQADFAFILKRFRATYLQNALFETVKNMKITDIDKQLAQYVSDKDLALMAQYGLRGELLFPVPVVLERNPYLLGYYRLLMGYSQKEFYGNDKGFGAGPFKGMEVSGKIAKSIIGISLIFAQPSVELLLRYCAASKRSNQVKNFLTILLF